MHSEQPPGAEISQLKVWIAGASGFSGRAITLLLGQQSRYLPLPHIRPSSSRLERLSAEWGDLNISPQVCPWDEVDARLQEYQPDVIVSCIGTTKRQARRGGGSYSDVDFALNAQLIEAAERLDSRPHFIYISAMGAQWGAWSAYLKARMDVEQLLRDSKLSCSVIRPAFLSGESRDERRSLEALGTRLCLSLARGLSRVGLRKLAHQLRPLDAPELAAFVLHILDHLPESMTESQRDAQDLYLVNMIHETLSAHQLSAPLALQ